MIRQFERLITALFLSVLTITLLFCLSLAYLIVTPIGGRLLVRYFKQEFDSVGLMHIGHYEGTLHTGFTLKDVRILGLTYFPDALLRIQEVRVHLPLWDLPHSYIGIFNARIFLPDSDPVVFTGEFDNGQIKGNLYANSVDLHAASRFWATEDIKKNLRGFISNADVVVQGPLQAPRFLGHFLLDNVKYKSVILTDGFTGFGLTLIPAVGQPEVKGEMILESGNVEVQKIGLKLSQSRIIFQRYILNPIIDIHLAAKVEDMDIHLAIKGTAQYPQLTVTSDPPMAPEDALRVLFTGNAWSASTSPLKSGTSNELAEEFWGYSMQGTDDDQEIGFKTKLTDNFKLGAEMDQTPLAPGVTNTYYTRKINGEMDMTEHMSLNVSQQIFSDDSYPSYQDDQPEDETQVYLQYKKRF